MMNWLILSVMVLAVANRETKTLQEEIMRIVEVSVEYPVVEKGDSCYYYNNLIIIKINGVNKVASITASDGSSDWFRKELKNITKEKKWDYVKLNALAKKEQLNNCLYVFSHPVYSDEECGVQKCSNNMPDNYFMINGLPIKGRLVFGPVANYHYTTTSIR